MSVDSINNVCLYNQIPEYDYDRAVYYRNNDEQNPDKPKEFVPKGCVGSARTEIAEKGLKYLWKNCKNFFIKLFKGDKETIDRVKDMYNMYDSTNKVIDAYGFDTNLNSSLLDYNV